MTAMRRVSAITSALRASIASGTSPNTSSSVTHDHTVQTDLMPCTATSWRTPQSAVCASYCQKYAWTRCSSRTPTHSSTMTMTAR